jgi:hypothetical protein
MLLLLLLLSRWPMGCQALPTLLLLLLLLAPRQVSHWAAPTQA